MSMTVLCNTICSAVIAFRIGENNSELFFTVDWIVVATLLAKHCEIMRRTGGESNRPRTEYMFGVSQIATVALVPENDSLGYKI
ncbi:hypothetical protein BDF19DRAFT_455119 [Syncephalis fuscata]|nr:hypothetical protein BDF19DRAFT_455119 [Syncephalis fuscata]